jgi:hypothetical protein
VLDSTCGEPHVGGQFPNQLWRAANARCVGGADIFGTKYGSSLLNCECGGRLDRQFHGSYKEMT